MAVDPAVKVEISEKVHEIAALPPGPATNAKATDFVNKILEMLNDPDSLLNKYLPASAKQWATLGCLFVLALLAGGTATFALMPKSSFDNTEMVKSFTDLNKRLDILESKIDKSPPLVKVTKAMIYVIKENDPALTPIKKFLTDNNITTEVKAYHAGMAYDFRKEKVVPMPCLVLQDATGIDLNIVSLSDTSEATIAWLKNNLK